MAETFEQTVREAVAELQPEEGDGPTTLAIKEILRGPWEEVLADIERREP